MSGERGPGSDQEFFVSVPAQPAMLVLRGLSRPLGVRQAHPSPSPVPLYHLIAYLLVNRLRVVGQVETSASAAISSCR
jgi:hypothetical protein